MPPIRHIVNILRRKTYPVAPDLSSGRPRDGFLRVAADLGKDATVLEVGTRQSVDGTSTHWQAQFPNVARQNYVMADLSPGADVDVVSDLHALPDQWSDRFDAVVAMAVFEHLERPWVAAREIARVLKPGGACYIATHQTYPLHAYPHDYFRFSTQAATLLFEDAGLRVIDAAYEHRVSIEMPRAIVPRHLRREWNAAWPSYLCVHLHAAKPGGARADGLTAPTGNAWNPHG